MPGSSPPPSDEVNPPMDTSFEEPPAKKRKLPFDNEALIPLNLQNIINKQKISTTIIDKFWQPLDATNSQSMDTVLNIALLKTLEAEPEVSKASRTLSNVWLNPANPESFKARLDQTKLPPPNSMYSTKVRIKANEIKDVLSYDSVSRKRTVLETYLLAELKQLQELEEHYNQSLLAYQLDLEYLQKFKRTVKKHQLKLDADIDDRQNELHLIEYDKKPDDIYLQSNSTYQFDPDQDEDTRAILEQLNELLLNITTSDLHKLNEKLEVLSSMLD
ncbi:hypothetical protein Cantr_03184 [Candida viswanathii]|uniref:Uncharacterized protein n=1 Tax=Candida viswanathii TaxID=5486 RepID=A0A367YRG6_9ASCO|nr:hypothetical protein Cantr_03184 [Candida viswanathii]